MLKHLSAGVMTPEERSSCIKERNAAIKERKYSAIDGGCYSLFTTIIVGDNHKEAATYLQHATASAVNSNEVIEFEKETEDIFNVQVWSSCDFDLSAILNS